MMAQSCESMGVWGLFSRMVDRWTLRARSFGRIYAYVNPWHAAMDQEIEAGRVRSLRKAAEKRAERRSSERPMARL